MPVEGDVRATWGHPLVQEAADVVRLAVQLVAAAMSWTDVAHNGAAEGQLDVSPARDQGRGGGGLSPKIKFFFTHDTSAHPTP